MSTIRMRRVRRYQFDGPVICHFDGFSLDARAVDLSCRGIQVGLGTDARVFDLGALHHVTLPGADLLGVRVVWFAGDRLGACFVDPALARHCMVSLIRDHAMVPLPDWRRPAVAGAA